MPTAELRSYLRYTVSEPTSFVFQLAAQSTDRQLVLTETITREPHGPYELTEPDVAGNRLIRLSAEPGLLSVQYDATVRFAPRFDCAGTFEECPHAKLPTAILPYLAPSRYCESDRLTQFAVNEFGEFAPGMTRVEAICAWIRKRMTYAPGTTDERTTACDVLVIRKGVCRDYAHLAIAFCRALCIPARYVSAYAVGLAPSDFHGVFEAYLDSDWYVFDPTFKAPVSGLMRIGVGRDAADTSFATIIGAACLEEIAVQAQSMSDDMSDPALAGTHVISTVGPVAMGKPDGTIWD